MAYLATAEPGALKGSSAPSSQCPVHEALALLYHALKFVADASKRNGHH